MDECVEIPDVCGPNSICNNTVGSHNCSCKSGYNVTDPNLPINSNNTCEGMIHCFLGDFYNLSFSSDLKNVDIVHSHFLLSL